MRKKNQDKEPSQRSQIDLTQVFFHFGLLTAFEYISHYTEKNWILEFELLLCFMLYKIKYEKLFPVFFDLVETQLKATLLSSQSTVHAQYLQSIVLLDLFLYKYERLCLLTENAGGRVDQVPALPEAGKL